MPSSTDEEITASQALEILGYRTPSTIHRYIDRGLLAPSRQLPGATGTKLFWRSDIEALRDRQVAERGDHRQKLAAGPRRPIKPDAS